MSPGSVDDSASQPPESSQEGRSDAAPAQSVAELVREHDRVLHALLMSRLHDEHEAREVAQEAYVRMLKLEQPGAISFLRAYLFKTALNIATDRARHRQVRERFDARETLDEPVDERSPERHVLSGEDLDVLRQALTELSPKCRRAFLLYRLEDWSADRIAAHMGIKVRMVQRYLARASVYCGLRVQGLSPGAARAATHESE